MTVAVPAKIVLVICSVLVLVTSWTPVDASAPVPAGKKPEPVLPRDDACSTVKVSVTPGAVETGTAVAEVRLAELVVVNSVWYFKFIVVDILTVVRCSVMFATNVSMISCEEPWIVVEMLMLVTEVAVRVTRLVLQT